MDGKDYNKLLEILIHGNIDFIAIAVSPWHALGIDAFLYELSDRLDRKIKGVIIIEQHSGNYTLNEGNFYSNSFADIEYFSNESQSNNELTLSIAFYKTIKIIRGLFNIIHEKKTKKNKTIYLVTPLWVNISFIRYFCKKDISNRYKPVFILVDEGLGTYLSKKVWKLVDKKQNYSIIKTVKQDLLNKLSIDKRTTSLLRFLKCVELNERFLFKKSIPLKINSNIAENYKKIINLQNDLRMATNDSILIITQPFSEKNMMLQKDEMNIMKSLIDYLNELEYKVFLKPHPAEKINKYDNITCPNLIIIKDDLMAEKIIPNLNPNFVIGYTSTVLINSSLLYGITTISLVDMLLNLSNNELLHVSSLEFKKLMGNSIYFVNCIDEIKKLI
ncbi:polysialyltransferase family glycosyltransferase [Methanobacterium sp.]|uniref:polysialyltransferase family glycosyltransferase n=1 Tax=Methanobacterium sp. TaxID=2164 RepID=UPI002ABBAE2C|nr:polysialyltransferase family glycosyltransferase [Methanobacterium sp.]MDY9922947.1 polysialyltransferase family glycosyltransferase [Methanobacterium sp.]